MVSDLLSKVDGEELIALTAVALGISAAIIIAVTAIISSQIRRYRERVLTANLIHDLVDRGMSADEIERVVQVSAIQTSEDSPELAGLIRSRLNAALRK